MSALSVRKPHLPTLPERPVILPDGDVKTELLSGNSVTMRDYYGYIRPHTSVIFSASLKSKSKSTLSVISKTLSSSFSSEQKSEFKSVVYTFSDIGNLLLRKSDYFKYSLIFSGVHQAKYNFVRKESISVI